MGTHTNPPAARSEAFGISCRACGAARALGGACASCGSPAVDADEQRRLLTHRDRLRRLHQRVRAMAVVGLMHRDPSTGLAQASWLKHSIAVTFVLLPVGLLVALTEKAISCGAAVAVIAAVILVAWAGNKVSVRFLSGSAAVARVESAQVLEGLRATTAVRCPTCGANSAVLVFEQAGAVPCPWCETRLLAPAEEISSQVDQAQKLLVEQHEAVSGAIAAAAKHLPEQRGRRAPLGFHWSGGLCSGAFRKLPMWYGEDAIGGKMIRRLETTCKTGSDLWLFACQAENEAIFRQVAREWEISLPEAVCTRLGESWLVYRDDDQPLSEKLTLALPLSELTGEDCLVVDRGGVSLWRIDTVVGIEPTLLTDHRDHIATLVDDLAII